MKRLIEKIVLVGFGTCCRRAGVPTSRWLSLVNATTDGVVRPPSAFGMTVGSPPSMTAMHEFVVPRSIPSTLLIERVPPDRCRSRARNLSRVISDFLLEYHLRKPRVILLDLDDTILDDSGGAEPAWRTVCAEAAELDGADPDVLFAAVDEV